MRVLITGATGFVGSHAAAAIQAAGHEPVLLIRSPDKAARVFAPLGIDSETIVGDATDRASVEHAIARCDAVVHTAAVVALAAPVQRQHTAPTSARQKRSSAPLCAQAVIPSSTSAPPRSSN